MMRTVLRVREATGEKGLRQLRETFGYILWNLPKNRQKGTFELGMDIAYLKRAAGQI